MQVKIYTGSSTNEIMARIKEELGAEAIILSTQKTSQTDGVQYEIMAALDSDEIAPESLSGRKRVGLPLSPEEMPWESMRQEWSQLRKQLMSVLQPQMDLSLLTPRQQVILDYLEREGVRQEVLFSLWERFRQTPDESTFNAMSAMIEVKPWFESRWPHKIHCFAGPYGVGKTTTLLRLALQCKRMESEKKVLILNADRSQGKGRLFLRHYTELSGLAYAELESLDQGSELSRRVREYDAVFVDLPGLPRDLSFKERLIRMTGQHKPLLTVHAVLSPVFAPAQLDQYLHKLDGAVQSLVWTKLDEACNFGEILNQSVRTGLPVSLFCVAPGLKNSLAQPSQRALWKLLLRHELPESVL